MNTKELNRPKTTKFSDKKPVLSLNNNKYSVICNCRSETRNSTTITIEERPITFITPHTTSRYQNVYFQSIFREISPPLQIKMDAMRLAGRIKLSEHCGPYLWGFFSGPGIRSTANNRIFRVIYTAVLAAWYVRIVTFQPRIFHENGTLILSFGTGKTQHEVAVHHCKYRVGHSGSQGQNSAW